MRIALSISDWLTGLAAADEPPESPPPPQADRAAPRDTAPVAVRKNRRLSADEGLGVLDMLDSRRGEGRGKAEAGSGMPGASEVYEAGEPVTADVGVAEPGNGSCEAGGPW
ncbi:hypothetical protein GCM10010234_16090 [Streptomyces hawaiiensis]